MWAWRARWCQLCDTWTTSWAPNPGVEAWFTDIMLAQCSSGSPWTLSQRVNWYLSISMNVCTMWWEVFATRHSCDELFLLLQDAKGTALRPRSELEPWLMQNVLCLVFCKMHITPMHPQLEGMVECYVTAVKEHRRKVVSQGLPVWYSEGSYVCTMICCFGLRLIKAAHDHMWQTLGKYCMNFLFFTLSRLALWPTQPPIQWVLEIISQWVKRHGAWSWPLTSN
jgi:hypothetical protein